MTNKIINILLISLMSLAACKTSEKRYLPTETYRRLLLKCPDIRGKELNIYYMDGDCSVCIGKAIRLDSIVAQSPNLAAVFVSRSDNSVLTDFYFNKAHIKGCKIADADSILSNSGIKFNEIVSVSRDLSVATIAMPD